MRCLNDYITNHVNPNARNLHLLTDGCDGQNHKNITLQYLHSLILNGQLDPVAHPLFMRSLSSLPCDIELVVIQRMQKDNVEPFTAWNDMIRKRLS